MCDGDCMWVCACVAVCMYPVQNLWMCPYLPVVSSKMLLAPVTTGTLFVCSHKHRIHGETIPVIKNAGQTLYLWWAGEWVFCPFKWKHRVWRHVSVDTASVQCPWILNDCTLNRKYCDHLTGLQVPLVISAYIYCTSNWLYGIVLTSYPLHCPC